MKVKDFSWHNVIVIVLVGIIGYLMALISVVLAFRRTML